MMCTKLVNRYLIKFSYIGSKFNGVAIQKDKDSYTVHNVIESYIKNYNKDLFELKSPHIHISSRTDAGVHALLNTAHFDLIFNETSCSENVSSFLTNHLNKKFIQDGHLIR